MVNYSIKVLKYINIKVLEFIKVNYLATILESRFIYMRQISLLNGIK